MMADSRNPVERGASLTHSSFPATTEKECVMGISQSIKRTGRWIPFSKNLANAIGRNEAIFVAHFLFKEEKCKHPEGWIESSRKDICEETTLTYKEQRLVRDNLGDIIDEWYDRENHKLHFKVNHRKLDEAYDEASALWASGQLPLGQVPEDSGASGTGPEGTSYKEVEKLNSEEVREYIPPTPLANLPVVGGAEPHSIPKPVKPAKNGNGRGRWHKPEPIQRYGVTDESAAALAYAQTAFLSKTGHPPFWNDANVDSLHALFGKFPIDLAEFSRRWDIFLASDDPFDLKQGFSLIWFCRNPDRYIQRVVAKSKREQEIERSDKSLDQWLQGKQNEKKRLGSG